MRRAWLPTFMSSKSSATSQQGETVSNEYQSRRSADHLDEAAEDDDWSDISSICESLEGSNSGNRPSNGGIDAETKARLPSNSTSTLLNRWPYVLIVAVPSIFSAVLPPCGLHPQCAFENVNNRLRGLWLRQSHDPAITVSIIDLCKLVHDELETEEKEYPQGTLGLSKSRRPWRLEGIFHYELLWSKWLIREAEIQERLPRMSQGERDTQEFMDRMYPMPKELRLIIKNKANKEGILAQWTAWSRAKRGWPPVVESPDVPVTTDMSLGGPIREPLTSINNPRHRPENDLILEPVFATDARET